MSLEFETSFKDTKPDDYLDNPEYTIREVLLRTFRRLFNNSGISEETPEQIYALWTLIDEFVNFDKQLNEIKENEKNKNNREKI